MVNSLFFSNPLPESWAAPPCLSSNVEPFAGLFTVSKSRDTILKFEAPRQTILDLCLTQKVRVATAAGPPEFFSFVIKIRCLC